MKKKLIHRNDFDGSLIKKDGSFNKLTKRDEVIKKIETNWGIELYKKNQKGENEINNKYFNTFSACPICKSNEITKLLEKNALKIYKCQACEVGFQNPMPNSEGINLIYSQEYIMSDTYDCETGKKSDYKKFQYGAQQLLELNKNLSSIFDVGCGTGLSLKAYLDFGIRKVFGLEITNYDKYEVEKSFIFSSSLEELISKNLKFDAITLWDTLEHLSDPIDTLNKCYELLEKDGLILILVPNLESLATRLIKEKSPTFCIDHLFYYTKSGLINLFKLSKGFKLVHEETVISELSNIHRFLSFQDPYNGTPPMSIWQDFDWLTPDLISKKNLGSRLLLIGKKL